MSDEIITVSEFNDIISNKLMDNKKTYKIQGELFNVRITNNNLYYAIKDNMCSIDCIKWNIDNNYKNGDEVIASGKINFYKKFGKINLQTSTIEKIGIGDIQEKYEKLKLSFEQKGYFNKIKKQMPFIVNTLGILTSTDGAALQDILRVLKDANFAGKIYIKNCFVQGDKCPLSVRNGIKFFNKINKKEKIDALIISRGGGSITDLFGFSSRKVVKSIYKSKLFIISAIGHEIDNMLSDLVADLRAPTPTYSAELIAKTYKNQHEIINKTQNILNLMNEKIKNKLKNMNKEIINLEIKNNLIDPNTYLKKIIKNKIEILDNNINKLFEENEKYNIQKNLSKGFTLIIDDDNNLITDVNIFDKLYKTDKKITIVFNNGKYIL